jgi:rubredoxin
MPLLTSIPVQCDYCGYTWELELSRSIEAANGDTITFAPGSIDVMCPLCGTEGVNYTTPTANVTTEGIRGLFAVLRSVSATTKDLQTLVAVSLEAKESGAETEAIAEQIKTSIPRLKPVAEWMLSEKGMGVATWITMLLTFLALMAALRPTSTAPPASQTVVIECPSGDEQEIISLLQQIAGELHSDSKAPNTVGPSLGPGPENLPTGHDSESKNPSGR